LFVDYEPDQIRQAEVQTFHLFSQCYELGLDRIDVSAVRETALYTTVMDGNHFLNYLRARPFRRSTRQDKRELVFVSASGQLPSISPQVKVCRFLEKVDEVRAKKSQKQMAVRTGELPVYLADEKDEVLDTVSRN
jgi:hypothetical protein